MDKIKFGLKKQKQKILSKVGKVEISRDQEFDRLKDDFRYRQKQVMTTAESLSKLSQNIQVFSASLASVGENFSNMYPTNDPMKKQISRIRTVLEEFDEKVVQAFEKELIFECSDPLKKYLAEFNGPKEVIKQRDATKLEYDDRKSQLDKLLEAQRKAQLKQSKFSDKKQAKMPKAQEKLAEARAAYNESSTQAKTQMASVLDQSGDTLDPIMVGLSKSLVYFGNRMQSALSALTELGEAIESTPVTREKTLIRDLDGEDAPEYEYHSGNSTTDDASSNNDYNDSNSGYDFPTPPPMSNGGGNVDIPSDYETEWYYLDSSANDQHGPIGITELAKLYQTNQINDSTMVFGGDMVDWTVVDEYNRASELKNILQHA